MWSHLNNVERVALLQVWLSARQISRMSPFFHPHFKSFSTEGFNNQNEMSAFLKDIVDAMPDLQWSFRAISSIVDTVFFLNTISGTYSGKQVRTLPVLNQEIKVDYLQMFRFKDHLIYERHTSSPTIACLVQMGWDGLDESVFSLSSNIRPNQVES